MENQIAASPEAGDFEEELLSGIDRDPELLVEPIGTA